MKNKLAVSFFAFFSGFLICALGQPARLPFLGIIASLIGYALFFRSIISVYEPRKRLLLGLVWFGLVSAVQLSWMVSVTYQGIAIVFVYLFLVLSIGAQFGILTALVPAKPPFPLQKVLGLAGMWTLFEWIRVYAISGFTWNPAGMALASSTYSVGLATLLGVYGLSFFVLLTNLIAYKALYLEPSRKLFVSFLMVGLFPYLFGSAHLLYQDHHKGKETLSVLLIQTALTPEEKEPYRNMSAFVPPTEQWVRILSFLKAEKKRKIDLIVLPEGALPFSAFKAYYYLDVFQEVWQEIFNAPLLSYPALKEPLAHRDESHEWRITNAFWAQAIADYFQAEVILGLDDYDFIEDKSFNAAFHFKPNEHIPKRYEKRVLVPLVEYIPFEWCRGLAKKYGINDFFSPGKTVRIFQGKVPLSVSICYEETYSDLIRQSRGKGALLFVNITNDGWFPNTSLPVQHFTHGVIRAVENGVPVVRATNTGLTGAVDALGRVQKVLDSPYQSCEKIRDALFVEVPLFSYATLYTYVGDGLIIGVSFLLLFFYLKIPQKNNGKS